MLLFIDLLCIVSIVMISSFGNTLICRNHVLMCIVIHVWLTFLYHCELSYLLLMRFYTIY